MKQIKVSEASGIVLDYLVAKCEGFDYMKAEGQRARTNKGRPFWMETPRYHPHNDWSQGGPIFEREIDNFERRVGYFYCHRFKKRQDRVDINFKTHPGDREAWATGPTLLVAGLRCWVMSQLGETAEVPEELV